MSSVFGSIGWAELLVISFSLLAFAGLILFAIWIAFLVATRARRSARRTLGYAAAPVVGLIVMGLGLLVLISLRLPGEAVPALLPSDHAHGGSLHEEWRLEPNRPVVEVAPRESAETADQGRTVAVALQGEVDAYPDPGITVSEPQLHLGALPALLQSRVVSFLLAAAFIVGLTALLNAFTRGWFSRRLVLGGAVALLVVAGVLGFVAWASFSTPVPEPREVRP